MAHISGHERLVSRKRGVQWDAVQSYMGHQHYSTTQRHLHHKPRRAGALVLQEASGSSVDGSGAGEKSPANGA